MADDQNDLEFQQVLNTGLSDMQTVPLESSVNDSQSRTADASSINFPLSNSSIFSLNYYKQFFNVKTEDVVSRLIMAINPLNNSFISAVEPPDLYGPVWISFTGPFLMLIFGNLTAWSEKGTNWKFNFSPFVLASTLTFLFVFGAPFLLRWATSVSKPPSIMQLICLFGYSMVYMIPIGFVCLLVGLKAHHVMSLIGSIIAAVSVFLKLNKSFDSPGRVIIPNVAAAFIMALLCFLVQLLLFK